MPSSTDSLPSLFVSHGAPLFALEAGTTGPALAHWGGQIKALPHITGALAPLNMGMDWQGARVVAFAGIGRPVKFFATLRGLGAQILHAEALGDHAPLHDALLQRLIAHARHLGADLVTTEKDAARLPPRYRGQVLTLPVRLQVDDWQPIDSALAKLGL